MRPVYAIFLALLLVAGCGRREATTPSVDLFQLALSDLDRFARTVAGEATSSYDKAHRVTTWFAENFDWTATDYERRTVQQILERRGGNCNELAMVTVASLEALGLQMRRVREINIHKTNDRRQGTAEERVREGGNRMSVFGRQHNDHVWIEIYDDESGSWFPADPSLGVVGEEQWLASRYGFGERFTLDPTSTDMIAPFAVFATDEDGNIVESRTRAYAIEGFNELYDGSLESLDGWSEWVALVTRMDEHARAAFEGRANLHEHGNDIARLAELYQQLRDGYGT